MSLLKLALLLLRLAGVLIDHLERRRWLKQGELIQIERARKAMDDAIARAEGARGAVRHDADSVRDDPDNRDNHGHEL